MLEKVIATASRYNGIQVTIEAKCGETWWYIAAGYCDGLDIVLSHATPADVTPTLREAAVDTGDDPVRYAASNRMTGNFRTLLDTRGDTDA